MNVKRWVGISLACLVAFVAVYGAFSWSDNRKGEQILAQRNTELDGYDFAKSLALDSLGALTAKTETEYKQVGEKVKDYWDSSTWEEYFGTVSFGGGARDQSFVQQDLGVEIVAPDSYLVKITGVLTTAQNSFPVCMLYTVKNSRVVSVESLV